MNPFPTPGDIAATASLPAPAKLNLALRVVGNRSDGYHLLDSIIVPIAVCDWVCVEKRGGPGPTPVVLRCWPPGSAPDGGANLSARAAALYLERTASPACSVRIEIHKRIPAGAGLGGGSSDAAATLRLLNALAERPVPSAVLAAWALELGADVPFFLLGRPARMRGVGELLEPVSIAGGPSSAVVVVFPGVPLETRHVYAKYDDSLTSAGAASRIRRLTVDHGPLHEWLENDLEAAAFQILPELKNLKRQLRALGARGVLMTGSGSAVFGVWNCADEATAAARALRATGLWARATWILDTLPAIDSSDADDGRSPSW